MALTWRKLVNRWRKFLETPQYELFDRAWKTVVGVVAIYLDQIDDGPWNWRTFSRMSIIAVITSLGLNGPSMAAGKSGGPTLGK